jgi:hypothetical protein
MYIENGWSLHLFLQSETISERPCTANKMLCYVIHGLSTRYTIPAGYFFHSTVQFLKILVSLFFGLLLTIMHQMLLNLKIFAAER